MKALIFMILIGFFLGGCAHINQEGRTLLAAGVDPECIQDRDAFRKDVGECCDWTGNMRSYIIFADTVPARVYFDSCMKKRGYKIKEK